MPVELKFAIAFFGLIFVAPIVMLLFVKWCEFLHWAFFR